METTETNKELRQAMRVALRKMRNGLSEELRTAYSLGIADEICRRTEYQQANVIAAYKAIDGEVDPKWVIERIKKDGKQVCFPVPKMHGPLSFSTAKDWKQGQWGPLPIGNPVSIGSIDLILVPGIAFTSAGDRLGFGGGFYDRTLPLLNGRSIGLAYPFQIRDSMNVEPWDVPVDLVVVAPNPIST